MFGVAATGSCGTPATSVGVARDFLFTVRTAAAAKRWELRIAPDAPLQLVAPSWVADAIAIDLGLQAPGDNTYSTSRDEVNGHFREANIDPIWFIDVAPGQAAFSGCAFPANAHWLLFHTGTFPRLDAWELKWVVVRTNESLHKTAYSEFPVTFETVAYLAPAASARVVRGPTTANPSGATGVPTTLWSTCRPIPA